jgi:hypothetical protein
MQRIPLSQTLFDIVNLMSDVSEIDSEIASLTSVRNEKRTLLEQLVRAAGGKVTVPTVGSAHIQADSESHSYDLKAMDALVNRLRADGHNAIADAVEATRKTTKRAGGLRIRMEKPSTTDTTD